MSARDETGELRTAPATEVYVSGEARRLCALVIGDGFCATHPLPEHGSVVVGRSVECDVRIDHPTVSRRQAVLHLGAELAIEDLGSSNGTKVRGQALPAGRTTPLRAGDPIEFGTTLIVVQQRTAASGARPALGGGGAGAMARLELLVDRIAAGTISVLVLGETGAGKEILAERIHERSPRREHRMVRLNCAALTETLLESELFGYEAGAFTGATKAKPGLLEVANGGTVFLDEIGDLSLNLQVKLLRVLDERKVLRVGGLAPRPIDVRFIAATHRDLEARVAEGLFRQDLYFRLNSVTLVVPPLRERIDEIPHLVDHFLREAKRQLGTRGTPGLTHEAVEMLRTHPWPGNVRELRNVIERAVLLAGEQPIAPVHLAVEATPALRSGSSAPTASGGRDHDTIERQRIIDALSRCNGNQSLAAKELGIPRRTLVRRLETYKLPRPRKR